MLLFSKNLFFAYLLAIIFSPLLTATLYRITKVIKQNGQVIYFFSDHHELDNTKRNEINQKQLDKFVDIIAKAEVSSEKGLYILIESGSCLYVHQPGVIITLMKKCKELNLKKTVIENIDIRQRSRAAHFLMANSFNIGSLDFESSELITSAHESYGCRLDKFTSKEIFDEFNSHIITLTNYANTCNNPLLKAEFDEKIETCQKKISQLKHILEKEFEFDLRKYFLESLLQCTSPKVNLRTIEYISKLILEIGVPLMDLYTILRIHTLENVPELIVIAGGTHIANVISMLVKSSITLDVKNISIPKKYFVEAPFDLLTGSSVSKVHQK